MCEVSTWSCDMLRCMKGGSLVHKEVPLRRFAALPYLSMWKNKAWALHCHSPSSREQGAGRFVPDAASESTASSAGQGALISTVGLHALRGCVCVRALWCKGNARCPPGVQHQHQGGVLRNSPPCQSHLHGSFLHLTSSERRSVHTTLSQGHSQVPRTSKTWHVLTFLHKLLT